MTQPQEPAEDLKPDQLARMATTSEGEDDLGAQEDADEVSIDDALETDRAAADGPDSRNADGYGFDEYLERGGDDATAAEQGNREQDRMEVEDGGQELPEQL